MENFTVLKEKIFFLVRSFHFFNAVQERSVGSDTVRAKKNGLIELTNGVEQVHEEEDEGHPEGGHAHEHEPLTH